MVYIYNKILVSVQLSYSNIKIYKNCYNLRQPLLVMMNLKVNVRTIK